MLDELDIRDFVIAEHLRLHFAPGFNAITGETGAGKSLIIDALGILLGDRPGSDIVRGGAQAARIEATFLLNSDRLNSDTPNTDDADLQEILAESGLELDEDGVLIVSREIPANGRSSARINGRAVVQSTLAAIGSRLVDIHSQTEHLAILRPAEHVNYLDRYAGTLAVRAALAETATELRRVRAEIERLRQDERERTRRQDRLSYELQEIESADLRPDEEDELRRERDRLANAEQLTQLAAQAHAALEGDGEVPGATDTLGQASALLSQLVRLDGGLAAEAAQLEALQSQVAELSRTLRAYSEEVEYNPERLQQIEDRLALLSGLKRKYGATVEEVIGYAVEASRELEELNTSEERLASLETQERALAERLASSATALSSRRRTAAARLSAAVERELADLGMAGSRFAVRFDLREDAAGISVTLAAETVGAVPADGNGATARMVAFDRTGVDRVEFLVALNPGEPLRPLARVASGGETSRLMLALKTILGEADSVPTLVFDEVDAGVGGRSGHVVGAKLDGLAAHHQVICITHLAQIASMAQHHLAIAKQVEGERTSVVAHELRGAERLEEVAAMLGGVTSATRASARELLGEKA